MAYEDYLGGPGYEDWGEEFRETWENVPGVSFFRDYESERAEGMFYTGWVDRSVSADERHDAREDFFDYTGLSEDDFPWSDWREALGYE